MAILIRGAIGIGVGGVDLMKVNFGTGDPACLDWDTADANANMLKLQLPAGGAVDVPVFWIGTSIYGVDLTVLNGVTDPTLVVSSNTTPTTDYVTLSHNATSALLNVAGGSLALQIAGTTEALLNATNFTPGTNDGNALGVSGTAWADLFLASAAVIDFNAGNMTVTHAAGKLTVAGGTLNLAGNLVFDSALDIRVAANTAAALEIGDGTTNILTFDSRTTAVNTWTVNINTPTQTIASTVTARHGALQINAYTINLTGNTQVTSQQMTAYIQSATIAADGAGGNCTVDFGIGLYVAPPIEGANVTLSSAIGIRVIDAGGTPTSQYGIYINDLTAGGSDYGIYIAGADTAAIWVASADPILLGVAGTATGLLQIAGATSGVVGLTVAAAAGTWTMTLPSAANTNAGYQLTCAAADSITSWAAAGSLREYKELGALHAPQDALDKILNTRVYDFHFKPGMGTGDTETGYVGPVADEAPWAMHYKGGVVNPINTLGYTVLAFQALHEKIEKLQAELAAVRGAR